MTEQQEEKRLLLKSKTAKVLNTCGTRLQRRKNRIPGLLELNKLVGGGAAAASAVAGRKNDCGALTSGSKERQYGAYESKFRNRRKTARPSSNTLGVETEDRGRPGPGRARDLL